MATFSGAVQTFTRKNIMEDVANMIYNVDPDKTPFLSLLRRGSKPKGTYFEWLQDTHYEGNGNNAVVEGNDAAFEEKNPQTHPTCLLYTSPSPRDRQKSRMPSSA